MAILAIRGATASLRDFFAVASGRDALAGSIWSRLARSGCSGRPGSLDLAVLVAVGRSGWLDLAALGTPGRRFCCAWAMFLLISLRRGSVSSRSPWLLRFGCSARSRAPRLSRFGALGALLGDLGVLSKVFWALLGRSGVPLGRSWALLGRFGVVLDALSGSKRASLDAQLAVLGAQLAVLGAKLARSGCPWRPRWLDSAARCT